MSTPTAAVASALVLLAASPLLAGWTRALAAPVPTGRRRALGWPGWWRPRRVGAGRLALTALVAVLAGAAAGTASGGDASWAAWTVLALALVPLAVIDADHHRLPDALMVPALGLGAVLLVVAGFVDGGAGRGLGCLLAGLVVGAVFTALVLISPSSLGLGDAKLAALLAAHLAWLGIGAVVSGLAAGFVVGAVVALVLLITRRTGWRSLVALGPSLAVGALAVAALT